MASRHADAAARVAELETELALVVEAEAELVQLGDPAASLPERREALALAQNVTKAREQLAASPPAPDAEEPDEGEAVGARDAAGQAASELAVAHAEATMLAGIVATAEAAVTKAEALDAGAPCPTCGQALGDTFADVQRHRRAELDDAIEQAAAAIARVQVVEARAKETAAGVKVAEAALTKARHAWEAAAKQRARHEAAEEALAKAIAAANAVAVGLADADVATLRAEVDALTNAERRAARAARAAGARTDAARATRRRPPSARDTHR